MEKAEKFINCLDENNNYSEEIPFLLDMNCYFLCLHTERTRTIEKSKNKPKKFESKIRQNSQESTFVFLYKKGDDIRKDSLVLQAISLIKRVNYFKK